MKETKAEHGHLDASRLQLEAASAGVVLGGPDAAAAAADALEQQIAEGLESMQLDAGDRCVSWLPWYHDIGLVGCYLSLIANQFSVDLLKPDAFARRPR